MTGRRLALVLLVAGILGGVVYALIPSRGNEEISKIAFVQAPRDRGVDQVFVVNADGSGLTSLGEGYDPVWSRDGKRIAFTAYVRVDDRLIKNEVHIANPD